MKIRTLYIWSEVGFVVEAEWADSQNWCISYKRRRLPQVTRGKKLVGKFIIDLEKFGGKFFLALISELNAYITYLIKQNGLEQSLGQISKIIAN